MSQCHCEKLRDFIKTYFVDEVLRFPDGRSYREHAKELLSQPCQQPDKVEELLDRVIARNQPQASAQGGPIPLNSVQQELIKSWSADSPHGDLWGNDEARLINLTTFARSILAAQPQASVGSEDVWPLSDELVTIARDCDRKIRMLVCESGFATQHGLIYPAIVAAIQAALRRQSEPTNRTKEYAGHLCRLQEAITGAKMGTPESIATIDQLCERVDKMRQSAPVFDESPGIYKALVKAIDFAEWGWTIIANANGGNWETASKEWQEAAAKYRDQFHNEIRCLDGVPKPESAPVEAWRDGLSDELQKIVAAIDTDYERKVFNISFIQRRLKYGYVRAIDCANQLAALGAIEFRSNSEIIPLWQRRVST